MEWEGLFRCIEQEMPPLFFDVWRLLISWKFVIDEIDSCLRFEKERMVAEMLIVGVNFAATFYVELEMSAVEPLVLREFVSCWGRLARRAILVCLLSMGSSRISAPNLRVGSLLILENDRIFVHPMHFAEK